MGLNSKMTDSLNIAEKIELLKGIQGNQPYPLVALTKETLANAAAKKIPGLTSLLDKMSDSGIAVTKIGENLDHVRNTPGTESVAQGFAFGSLVMAGFDFIRIPIIYFSAYLLKQKVPVNLNNNARWFYAGILLGLTITALAAPVTAPVIAFIVAGFTLGLNGLLLGKVLYDRYQLGKERKQNEVAISVAEKDMSLIQHKAQELEALLRNATQAHEVIALGEHVDLLHHQYRLQQQTLFDLKNKQLHVDQKIQDVGAIKVLDRSIALAFASLSVIGLVVSVFFPPVGLALLTMTALAGGTYLLARLSAPVVNRLINWVKNKVNGTTKDMQESKKTGEEPSLVLDVKPTSAPKKHSHDSTLDLIVALGAGNKKQPEQPIDKVAPAIPTPVSSMSTPEEDSDQDDSVPKSIL